MQITYKTFIFVCASCLFCHINIYVYSPINKVLESSSIIRLLSYWSSSNRHFLILSWTKIDQSTVILSGSCLIVVLRCGLESAEVTETSVVVGLSSCILLSRLELCLPLWLLLLLHHLVLVLRIHVERTTVLLLHIHLLLLHLAIEELRSEATSVRLLHLLLLLLLLLHHLHLLHLHVRLLLLLHLLLLTSKASHCVESMVLVSRGSSIWIFIIQAITFAIGLTC